MNPAVSFPLATAETRCHSPVLDDGKYNSPYRLILNGKTYFNLLFFCIFKKKMPEFT